MFDRLPILCQCQPFYGRMIDGVQAGVAEYATTVPAELRAAYLRAHPMMTNCAVVRHLELRFGVNPNQNERVQEIGGNRMLLLCGEPLSVALRPKQLGENHQSSQHRSGQQDVWHREGQLRIEGMPALALTMLGWVCSNDLEPRLLEIAITQERQTRTGSYAVVWSEPIWREGEGQLPVRPDAPDLFTPPAPDTSPEPTPRDYKVRRPGRKTGGEEKRG